MKGLRTTFRLLTGLVFIFSGFVKGVDPVGTVYRMQDYFMAFGTTWANDLALPLTIFLCTLEFLLGISLFFNLYIRKLAWVLLPMMTFFTVLTYFDAFYNMVPDCGCFGDAVKLTNMQTFIKNLVLMGFVVPVFIWRNKYRERITPAASLTILSLSALLFAGMSWYCLWHLPLLDFRDWKIGNRVTRQNTRQVRFFVTYQNQKTGEVKEFQAPDYPWNDSTWLAEWSFVSQRAEDPGKDEMALMIEDREGNDLSAGILVIPDYHFLVVAYSLDDADPEIYSALQSLYTQVSEAGYSLIGLTGSLPDTIDAFRARNSVEFDFYNSDDIILKSMIRSNPGLILLKDGVVVDKWHYRDLPGWDYLQKTYLEN